MNDMILRHIAAQVYDMPNEVDKWLEVLPPAVGEKLLGYCIEMQEAELQDYTLDNAS